MLASQPAEIDQSPLEGLTAKEYQFIRLVFRGESQSDAYRAVYDCSGMADAQIWQRAHEVFHRPKVQGKLRALRVESDRETVLAPSLTTDFVLQGIRNLAINADSDSVRLAAFVHLGKTRMLNLFGSEPADQKTKARSPEDVERELRDLLARLQPSIEGTARDVTPAEESLPPRRQRKPRR